MSELEGTSTLVRLVVRRDRARMLVWIGGIVTLVVASAASTKGIYPTQHDLDAAARLAEDNPVALAFNGPAFALDTIGGQIAFQIGAFGLTIVGLMCLLTVGRLTRAEEDSGRLELVRAMPVGPYAPLAAGLLVAAGLVAVVGILVGGSLALADLPVYGCVVFGASYVALGLLFIGITAVAAQVSENPRVVGGIAGGALGASFALRALGDAGTPVLSWCSPIGWAQQARPFAGERWWPLGLCVAGGLALMSGAAALAARRDFGSGLFPPRPGPSVAAPALRSPLGLAVRLNRAAIGWWSASVLLLGVVYGSLAESIDDFVSDNEILRDLMAALGEAPLIDSYLATSLLTVALLSAGPGLQVAQRLRSEEVALRAEAMLATPASRWRWVGSHLVVGVLSSAFAVVAGGAGVGIAYAATGGGARQVPRLLAASLAYVPAACVLTALAVALFGFSSRWIVVAWGALGACFVIGMFGSLLGLPQWVVGLSPFQHTPAVPADGVRALPLVVLSLTTAGLVAVGLRAFRARDLASS